jgi:hypothetical protein
MGACYGQESFSGMARFEAEQQRMYRAQRQHKEARQAFLEPYTELVPCPSGEEEVPSKDLIGLIEEKLAIKIPLLKFLEENQDRTEKAV